MYWKQISDLLGGDDGHDEAFTRNEWGGYSVRCLDSGPRVVIALVVVALGEC